MSEEEEGKVPKPLEDVGEETLMKTRKSPTGTKVITVPWFPGSIFDMFQSLESTEPDQMLPHLSSPSVQRR